MRMIVAGAGASSGNIRRDEIGMPVKPLRPCGQFGCPELIRDGRYCDKHRKEFKSKQPDRRGSASSRGYGVEWRRYSKWFLHQPENIFCVIKLPGCTNLSQCVDHIDPPDGPHDPRFWDKNNYQPSCIHCNSVKGHRKM